MLNKLYSKKVKVKLEDGIPLTNIKEIIIRDCSAWYLTNNGEVWASGRNGYGQLGTGDKEVFYSVYVSIHLF